MMYPSCSCWNGEDGREFYITFSLDPGDPTRHGSRLYCNRCDEDLGLLPTCSHTWIDAGVCQACGTDGHGFFAGSPISEEREEAQHDCPECGTNEHTQDCLFQVKRERDELRAENARLKSGVKLRLDTVNKLVSIGYAKDVAEQIVAFAQIKGLMAEEAYREAL